MSGTRGATARSPMRLLMTQSAYARHRGVSRQAIHALVRRRRISLTENGLIDVRAADLRLAKRLPVGRPRLEARKIG